VPDQTTVIDPYKNAFFDMTIASDRLTAARLQLANAWSRVQDGNQSAETKARSLCSEADDLQNRLNALTDRVRRAWSESDA
jgi:hypothetical protein